MFCSKCGQEINNDAVVCIHCGCAVAAAKTAVKEDEVNIGLCVLSGFIPLFGLIYWAIQFKTYPKTAKACGLTALIVWVCTFFISMISMAVIATL